MKKCTCELPNPVVSSPIDEVETCRKCGKIIEGAEQMKKAQDELAALPSMQEEHDKAKREDR